MTEHPPANVQISHHDDVVIAKVPDNLFFPAFALRQHARHDPASDTWHFPPAAEPSLRQHCIRLFGTTSSHGSWNTVRLRARADTQHPLPIHILGRPLILAGEAGTLRATADCELIPPAGRGEAGSWYPVDSARVARLHPGASILVHGFPANLMAQAYRAVTSRLCPFHSISVCATHHAFNHRSDPLLGDPPLQQPSPDQDWQAAARHLYDFLQTGNPCDDNPHPGEPFHNWQRRFFAATRPVSAAPKPKTIPTAGDSTPAPYPSATHVKVCHVHPQL